jgi:carboxymethylenebutenolidase
VNASIMYYGQFEPEADFKHMKASILGHFGEDDTMIPVDNVEIFRANLATASGDHAVYIYPNAGHAFSNKDSSAYNKEAAELSWQRTLSFLEEEL